MSFILDALRKSDARRKQGGVPDIHSPEPALQASARGRHRALWLALAVLAALALALSIWAWKTWAPGGAPDAGQDEPAPIAADGETGQEDRSDSDTVEGSEQGAADAETRIAEPDTASENRRRRRVPPDEIEREAPPVAREPQVRESEPVSAEVVADELGQQLAEAERERQRERRREAEASRAGTEPSEREVRRSREQAETEQRADVPEAVEQAPTRNNSPDRSRDQAEESEQALDEDRADAPGDSRAEDRPRDYIEAWELPLSARRSLPEMALNMHVYSPRAQERFVLINGERRVEGDDLGDGAELVEIRREGALIEFRDHRFLLRRR